MKKDHTTGAIQWLQKMAGPTNFSHSSFVAFVASGIRDPGSRMDKNKDMG
jgi:hypothetical protein